MMLPIFLPAIIVGLGFVAVYGNAGYINTLLQWLHLQPIQFLYSPAAIIASHCWYNIPLAYIAIRLRLHNVGYGIIDNAKVCGASSWNILRTITWPRIKRTVAGVSSIIMLYAAMSFALPLVLGGSKYQTIEVTIYRTLTQQYDIATATTLAIMQFIVLALILLSALWFSRKSSVIEQRSSVLAKHTPAWWLRIVRILFAAFILAPIIAIALKSLPLSNYSELFITSFPATLGRTLLIALIASVTGVTLSTTLVLSTRSNWKWWPIAILALSPVTLGLAWRLWLDQSLPITVIAYCALIMPIAITLIATQWNAQPKHILETLTVLGANRWQQYKTSLTLLRSSIIQATALIWIFVLGDIAIASILTPSQQPLAMQFSYRLMSNYRLSLAATGMTTLLLIMTLGVSILFIIKYHYEPRTT